VNKRVHYNLCNNLCIFVYLMGAVALAHIRWFVFFCLSTHFSKLT